MKKLLFLDTETSGLTPKHGVIQIASYIDGVNSIDDIELIKKFDFTCNIYPEDEVSQEALNKTRKTREEIASYRNPSLVFNDFNEIVQNHRTFRNNLTLVGYNTRFDYDMMGAWYDKGSPLNSRNNPQYKFFHLIGSDWIDVQTMIVDLFLWNKIKLDNIKLETIAPYFKIPHKAHDAYSDIEVTREIFYRIKRMQIKCMPFSSMLEPFEFKKSELEVVELE